MYLPFFLTDNDNYFGFDDTQLKKAPIKKYLHATPQQMYIPIVPQIVRSGLVNSLQQESPIMMQMTSKLRIQKPTVAHITLSLATPSNSSLTETRNKRAILLFCGQAYD